MTKEKTNLTLEELLDGLDENLDEILAEKSDLKIRILKAMMSDELSQRLDSLELYLRAVIAKCNESINGFQKPIDLSTPEFNNNISYYENLRNLCVKYLNELRSIGAIKK